MRASIFVGTSLDGFLARPDGAFDFLPVDGGEPHGFAEFMATVDALVMGRNTFDVVAEMNPWPYGKKPVIVLSHRPLGPTRDQVPVERLSGTPAEIVATLAARGMKHLYVDGGITIQQFLNAGLIQQLTITRVPVLIGSGISLFGQVARDIKLSLVESRSLAGGMVQSVYQVEGSAPSTA
jgi:dihydrofolate reductase